MIHLDTTVLVDALTGTRRSARELRRVVERGERIAVSTLVLCEWLRGPRVEVELADQEDLCPADQAVPFGPREAAEAAQLYRRVPRARGREFDLCVAACALVNGAALWTLNGSDFRDVPGLRLHRAGGRDARASPRVRRGSWYLRSDASLAGRIDRHTSGRDNEEHDGRA